jgi:hypothetical protein
MWQITIAFMVGGTIGIFLMALMNTSAKSDIGLADFIMETQHKKIIMLHTTLVELLRQSTGPNWDYHLASEDNREFLQKVSTVIESINMENKEDETIS